MTAAASPLAALAILLRALKLPTIARHAEEIAQVAEREGWSFVRYLHHLVELEVHERRRRRIERNLRQSELPPDKTLATLVRSRLPAKVAKLLPTLCEGTFLARGCRRRSPGHCQRCARARSSSAATTCSRSACRAAARRTSCARSATS